MNGMIEYKGFTGIVDFDPELDTFTGYVVGVSGDQIYFEGASVEELRESMKRAVDHYLDVAAKEREEDE